MYVCKSPVTDEVVIHGGDVHARWRGKLSISNVVLHASVRLRPKPMQLCKLQSDAVSQHRTYRGGRTDVLSLL